MKAAWLLGLVAITGTAHAQPYIEQVKVREGLHEIELAVSNAPSLNASDYVLQERDGSARVVASRVETESTAIAFVIESGDPMLPGLLEQLDLRRFPGAVSSGIVIEYGTTVRVIGAGRLDELRTSRLHPGAVETGRLLDGFERAIEELDRTASDRRTIIVLGRGDIGETEERRSLLLRRLASAISIRTYAVVRPTQSLDGIRTLIPQTYVPKGETGLAAMVRGVADRMANSKRVEFPQEDAAGNQLRWDGTQHDLILALAGEQSWQESIVLPRVHADSCCESRFAWWWAALAGVLAILIAWSWSRRAPSGD